MASNDISMNICIIDDDPIICEMIKDALTKKFPAFNVSIFSTGEEALAGSTAMYDAVILDYSLDSVKADALNGLQVLAKLRERNDSLPVIFLTSQDRPDVAANTIKYGAYDYILKTESAFSKVEIAIQNLMQLKSLKTVSVGQRIMNSAFWILLLVVFLYVVVSRFISN